MRSFAQVLIGAMGYQPLFDARGNSTDGTLSIVPSIPLAGIDPSEPSWLLVYMNVLGQRADEIGQQMAQTSGR